MTVNTVWQVGATLGEGPVWDAGNACLWFVDIKGRKVHRLDPATGDRRSWDAPAQIGWVLPAEGGCLLAGMQTGLSRFDPESGTFSHLVEVEPNRPGNRLNDATVGPDGTVWFGSMDDAETDATGHVYRWDGATVIQTAIPAVMITNGPALTPDGQKLYHVDTAGGIIHAVPVAPDGSTGTPAEFARIAPADGNPDGPTVDSQGNVWVGLWGGGRARCYAPDGTLRSEVALPASNVTKIALGGPDLKTAYATTARIGLDAQTLEREPLAGSVFSFAVDVAGQEVPLARL
ncbi:SMP-30/gluconolactonase/LRE family protein [Stakelama marina]|uniref:SMP-30/gluconolactonase/LRE family protein n=1 Tax=Stakelama marina TaxID=2826939 RepID=A0A8T4IE28_9SPHN|nr:SMP-30/gluconolactonase/LRE family protein [Stakelama marina]MBR0552820.1 SMP-30/gluconolactonase/LRE family protein [Stakelama marina]